MFSGGFGNGKTTAGCMKLVYLLANFPGYRVVIARYEESKLKQTTLVTFYKVCPPILYSSKHGGNRADSLNRCLMVNGSQVMFMNLKDVDDGMIRGLEINSVLIDQCEEISESMWLMLSARVNRWDGVTIPDQIMGGREATWPKFPNGKYQPPSYMMGLCNPDSELHWIYRRFHPKSEQFQKKYHLNHTMIQAPTTSATISEELLDEMLQNDPAWVARFVRGEWGIPGGQIHSFGDKNILRVGSPADYPQEKEDGGFFGGSYIDGNFIKTIIERGNLCRVLDHGDAAPTCCLWFSAYKGNYICYREYYKENTLISEHRRAISELSVGERYLKNIIDPACASKHSQKYNMRWSVIDEYADKRLGDGECTPIYWIPGNNDELSTRNRISELLRNDSTHLHPVNGNYNAPRLYFIEKSPLYPSGCYHAISQLRAQRREKIGNVEGRDIYSDDRDPNIEDHAYDPLRYYCADHAFGSTEPKPQPKPNSFVSIRKNMINYRRGVESITSW